MLLDFASLSSQTGKSMYLDLSEQIKAAVSNGIIKKGEKLPSIREAALQLNISKTTVENAYMKLCIEGIVESFPQKGYFICQNRIKPVIRTFIEKDNKNKILYDFSSQKIDTMSADTDLWKKIVRSILRDSQELTSYGDSQGEFGLRSALATYSYKARGVRCTADNIVIGAGIGPLLNILCGLIGRNVKVGIENGGFKQAFQMFTDYGIDCVNLPFDSNGATLSGLEQSKSDILFLLPSSLSKISVTSLSKRRNEYIKWSNGTPNRLIIEDDYNGELRYTARSVSAFQGKCPESTVYIGSFSKLLLPSVRIAYMVLPDRLMRTFLTKKKYYNQTCGKIEQLALQKYIETDALEKHLRRLRKLYYSKSQMFCESVKNNISLFEDLVLYESSLTVKLKLKMNTSSQDICNFAEKKRIRLIPCENDGEIKMCFAGIDEEDIMKSMPLLNECLNTVLTIK